MGEHLLCTQKVKSSNLFISTSRGVAQSGSASGLGPEGREFESLHSDHSSQVYISSCYLNQLKHF